MLLFDSKIANEIDELTSMPVIRYICADKNACCKYYAART